MLCAVLSGERREERYSAKDVIDENSMLFSSCRSVRLRSLVTDKAVSFVRIGPLPYNTIFAVAHMGLSWSRRCWEMHNAHHDPPVAAVSPIAMLAICKPSPKTASEPGRQDRSESAEADEAPYLSHTFLFSVRSQILCDVTYHPDTEEADASVR